MATISYRTIKHEVPMRSLHPVNSLFALLLLLMGCGGDDAADQKGKQAPASQKTQGDAALDASSEDAVQTERDADADAEADAASESGSENLGHDASLEPPAACLLPFEAGSCLAYLPVFAYDPSQRACVSAVYGGCGGNENRFGTRAACEARCGVSETYPSDCPTGTQRSEVCLACGLAGGCADVGVVCARTCDEPSDCKGGNEWPTTCHEGICQVYGCI